MNTYAYADGNPVNFSDPLGLATYMCMKPLDFLTQRGWDNTGKRTGVESIFNPAHHQYICVKNGNVEVCGGQDLDRSKEILPGYGEGKPSNDNYDPNRCEQIEPDRQCVEQCVIRKIQDPKRPFYGVLGPGTNCQEWAVDTIWDCRKECSPW